MRSNAKHSSTELEKYILLYLEEGLSFRQLKKDHGLLLCRTLFLEKVHRYHQEGLLGIQTRSKNNQYSQSFKLKVVQEHLQEGVSPIQLARQYRIPSASTVRNWIIKYTKRGKIRSDTPLPEVYTMKGKKTSHQKKIEIVQDYLTNGLSYKDTALKYQVSYNNVYSWVQKYKKHGPDGLIDGRGRGKPQTIQTAEERLRTEIIALKARNDYLEAENAALKKLEEVERELMLHKFGTKQNIKPLRSSKRKDSK